MTQIVPDPPDDAYIELRRLLQGFGHFSTGGIPGDLLTETLHPTDPGTSDCRFGKSKIEEMCRLFFKHAFTIICREELPPNAKVLGCPIRPRQ